MTGQDLRGRVLAAWISGTTGTDVRWLIADQLGTPRIILDQSGSLASTTRHDYLPFGEDLNAGGRTTANGYAMLTAPARSSPDTSGSLGTNVCPRASGR